MIDSYQVKLYSNFLCICHFCKRANYFCQKYFRELHTFHQAIENVSLHCKKLEGGGILILNMKNKINQPDLNWLG